jgi:hypothetical protein
MLALIVAVLFAFTLTRPRESVPMPAPAPASTSALTVDAWIVDGETGAPLMADVYLDRELIFHRVERFRVEVPSGAELRVEAEAEGYSPWALRFHYRLSWSQVLRGPVRLFQEKGRSEGKDSRARE